MALSKHERADRQCLLALPLARRRVLGEAAAAAHAAGYPAVLSVGSVGRGNADEFSDLDVIAVAGPGSDPFALGSGLRQRLITWFHDPARAPSGGAYSGVCLAAANTLLWVDLFVWPAATAAMPIDGAVVYAHTELPHTDRDFVGYLHAHAAPTPPSGDPPETALCTLRRLAVAAKYLARNDIGRLKGTGLGVRSLKRAAPKLHDLTQGLYGQVPAAAVGRTHRLIMLAEYARQHPRRAIIPGTVPIHPRRQSRDNSGNRPPLPARPTTGHTGRDEPTVHIRVHPLSRAGP